MRMRRTAAGAVMVTTVVVVSGLVGAGPAAAVSWRNCDAVHRTYPHGVGKVGARDHTSGTPVTSFKRSNALYRTAMRVNSGLDRDKDGIACEAS
ncbi:MULTISPECIES: excalibur calcium-binding domain-containing protein [unclassified Nocardioides]|uniref:excalibur calcium-binding domain-containing protein n=1 Tax=unclassified Nocardioides TaxID=2615069 RepID=UPI0009EADD2F|nr:MULTISPECIES: excalibur calcium-binding domain-containing protein [unclassified Nocardioides]